MNINKAFFPCAGKGTRMGKMAKSLPKPLWPLFETTLLELQILYSHGLGFRDFIINTHHLSDQFKNYPFKSVLEPKIIEEEVLLGSGGCFHNLKHEGVGGNAFVFNPDSFLMLSESDWEQFKILSRKYEQVLIATPCKKEDPYNRFLLEGMNLKKIVPPSPEAPEWTYSGFGKVSLDDLKYKRGESGFFESVARVGEENLVVFKPHDDFEFWDFGTIKNYKENVRKILNGPSSKLSSLLIKNKLLDDALVGRNSYHSANEGVINFSGEEIDSLEEGVYFHENTGPDARIIKAC